MLHRITLGIFTVTLGISLLGGILLVLAQTVALVAGQGPWLVFLNDTAKIPVVIAASICAVAGFVLSYRTRTPAPAAPEAARR